MHQIRALQSQCVSIGNNLLRSLEVRLFELSRPIQLDTEGFAILAKDG